MKTLRSFFAVLMLGTPLILLNLIGAALSGCATQPAGPNGPVVPSNQALIRDGQLAVTILSTVTAAIGQEPGVSAEDIKNVQTGLAALQNGLTLFQNGKTTPADFANLATQDIALLSPMLLNAFQANANIRAGVVLLEGLIPIITAEVVANQTPARMAAAARAAGTLKTAQAWADANK